MRDVVSSHEGSKQMGDGTSLTTVRPEHECVHPPLSGKQKINRYNATERKHFLQETYYPMIVKYALPVSIYCGEEEI